MGILHGDLLASPGMIQPKTCVKPPSRLDTGGNVLMLTVWRGSKHVNGAVHGFLVKTFIELDRFWPVDIR